MPTQNRPPISDFAVAGTWSGVVGSRYTLVADYPDTTGANYVAHGTAAGNIAFGFVPFRIPANAFAISVQVRYYDAEPSAGTNNIRARLRVGGVYFQEPTSHNPAGVTYAARSYDWALNPQTSLVWTVADINGTGLNRLQHFGLISADANPAIRISCIEIQVTYQVGDYIPAASTYTVANNTYFHKPKDVAADRIEIEIGDVNQPTVFVPHVRFRRWDDEVNFGVGLADANISPVVANNSGVIEWRSSSGSARFYQIQPDAQNEDGGVEFEIVLAAKPPINYLDLPVQSKNVNWFYQPPLTSEWSIGGMGGKIVSVTETEARDASDTLLIYRPPNVVGSYALYHSLTPGNVVGGKEYKCCKFCHIYRPMAIDAVGGRAWCSLSYNGVDTLRLMVPQVFLDAAVYPVIIDPTFGNTAQQATQLYQGPKHCSGFFQAPAAGNITSISTCVVLYEGSNPGNVNAGYYTGVIGDVQTHVAHGTSTAISPASKSFQTVNVAGAISAGVNYWLEFQQAYVVAAYDLFYDSAASSNAIAYDGSGTYDNWASDPATYTYASSVILSIYATYTAAGGGLSFQMPSEIPAGMSRGMGRGLLRTLQ